MPIAWIDEAPRPDEREPGLLDKSELDWAAQFDIEIREAQRRAYLAVQECHDELYARLEEDERT